MFKHGLDHRAASYTSTVLFILVLLALVYIIRETLFAFALALLFSYLLWPVMHYLDRRLPGRSRVPALAIVYLLMVALLILSSELFGLRKPEMELIANIARYHRRALPQHSHPSFISLNRDERMIV
jgi:predicted PurR-regulated permease PerM